MPYRLAIDDGRAEQTLDVTAARLSVGTSAACRLRLGSLGVAVRHAAMRQEGDHVVVEDLSRAANITVDGRPVASASVVAGQVIGIGAAKIRVLEVTAERVEAPPAAAVAPKSAERPTPSAKPPSAEPSPAKRFVPVRPARVRPATRLTAPAEPRTVLPSARRKRKRFTGPFGLSVAFHAMVLAILHLTMVANPVLREDATIGLRTDELLEIAEPLEEPVEETKPLAEPPPEPELAEVQPLTEAPEEFFAPPEPEPPPPPPPVVPRVDERVVVEEREEAATVGVGGPPEVPARSFDKDEAAKANGLAAEILASDRGGGPVLRSVQGRANDSKVWVVRGDYDQAERVFSTLEIDHAFVAQSVLEERAIPATLRVLVVNCSGKPVSDDAARRIAAWVEGGGWLLSTDWGLDRVVTRGFPGRLQVLQAGVKTSLTADTTVHARTVGTHVLLAGVPSAESFRWWLEDSSVPFRTGPGVDVLVRSDDLRRRNGADPVAAVFTHGKGTVLHLLGHVFQQEGTIAGAYSMQRIVVNFLDRALRD